MEFRAGERLKVVRDLMGVTRQDFADMLGIDFIRLRNVEQLRARMSEDEFAVIGEQFPELMPWLVYEGPVDLQALKDSQHHLCRLVAARIDAGQFPPGFHIAERWR